MRITRKVFSIYSEDELISAIEEKAFNEGYMAAQREFAEEDDEKKSSTRSKALGYGALGAGAATLGAIGYGTKGALDYAKTVNIYEPGTKTATGDFKKWTNRVINEGEKNPIYKTMEAVGKGKISVDEGVNKVRNAYTVDKTRQAIKNRKGYTELLKEAVKADPNNKLAAERLSAMNKVNKGYLPGRIAGASALALGAGYGVSRYLDKKKKND